MFLEEENRNVPDGCILQSRLDNAKNLSNILKAIFFKQFATVFISSNGLKFTVEDGKYIQASAYVEASLFQDFVFTEENSTFRVNLHVLLECLHIFGSTTNKDSGLMTALKMCYSGHGTPLKLLLAEEGNMITDCSINTLEPEDIVDFNFNSSDVTNKIIFQSEALNIAFQELDMTSEFIQILMSPEAPYFRISTQGCSSTVQIDYPKDSEMIESFECTQTQSNRYRTSLLKPSCRALSVSKKISIRMDSRGFLSLQYMIINDDGKVCFVEYLCAPNEELDEEEFDR